MYYEDFIMRLYQYYGMLAYIIYLRKCACVIF
jgi:hypothetical protein